MGACLACLASETCAGTFKSCALCCSCTGCWRGGHIGRNAPVVGRLRAVSVVLISVGLAVAGQRYLYNYGGEVESISLFHSRWLEPWKDGCDEPAFSDQFQEACIGNSIVFRASFADSVFFLLMAFGTWCSHDFNSRFWALKILLWLLLLLASAFVPNNLFAVGGYYIQPARIGAVLFIVLQQFVLMDFANRINGSLFQRAFQETGEFAEWGIFYLTVLASAYVILYAGSLGAIGAMFYFFYGCSANNMILSLSLFMVIMVTILQLWAKTGNLLTTAVASSYATLLCFLAVSITPIPECNPLAEASHTVTAVISIVATALPLIWVALGTSDIFEGSQHQSGDQERLFEWSTSFPMYNGQPTSPIPLSTPTTEVAPVNDKKQGWRLNVVMMLMSMFYAMMLTTWGDINYEDSGSPKSEWTGVWLAAGEFICIFTYGGTLVARRLFPNRELSI